MNDFANLKVAAAVVTYNRKILLQECLDALLQQSVPLAAIVVVDNASTDQTSELLRAYVNKYPNLFVVIRNTTNQGGSAGFFRAMKEAQTVNPDWTWVLDDDAIPESDALEKLLSTTQARESSTGALGCLVLNSDRSLFLPNLQCRVDRDQFQFQAVEVNTNDTNAIAVDTNSFVGMLIHRRAIETVGLPNPQYFIWYDDIEYSLRISKRFRTWLIPQSKIIHKAVNRDFEKRHWLFRSAVPVYPWQDCWRQYYGNRNRYHVARLSSRPIRFHIQFVKSLIKEILTPILFKQDHLKERLQLIIKAAYEGYTGRLGKTISLSPPFQRLSNFNGDMK